MSDGISSGDGVSSYCKLISQLRRGDRAAFETIVAQWQKPLFGIAYRIVGTVADAVEVRQAVFLRLMESPDRLPDPDKFGAWLRRCAINESLRCLRRKDTDRRAHNRLMEQGYAPQDNDPKDVVVRTEEVQLLRAALERLQPDERALLALRFDEELTFQQMANVLHRPATTVKSQFARTIGRLRELLAVRIQKE